MNVHTSPYRVGNFEQGEMRGDVSRQWFARPADERFLSLDDLSACVHTRAAASVEARVATKTIELFAPEPKSVEDAHKLYVAQPAGLVPFTHWSFSQVATLAKAPAGFLRELPAQMVADVLTYRLRFAREAEQIKLYSTPEELRAATGPDYGRIYDHEVVAAVQQIAGNGTGDTNWKVPGVLNWRTHMYDPEAPVTTDSTTLYASDRDVFIFLVDDRNPIEVGKLPDGSPDLMFRGFYVQNSEVGSRALKLAAFYLRAVCMNRNLWGVEGFEEVSIRHTRLAPSRFIEEIRPALQSFANGSDNKLIEGVQAAKDAKIADNDEEALAWLQNRGLSSKRAKDLIAIVERDEQHPVRSVWDAAQGMTRMSQDVLHQDARLDLELEAKRWLDKVA
ncbi:DUF932 domain-containing protein [Chelatococcus asaccharovorans]|uniref:Uncharacterized protein DUF932 n=1 Tax=Chelatococcus asaccharovorans TaxID=28210 RepID=A0A2V3UAW7_9HYPH|nr:DUF932 domain-containing protein [Chelatococcus asaccharovorans]MBS7703292.1 DUF932 domain-containing protein [Chelatococcus asaccharovorans]PXW61625.1 uncharacterized protein DUF932 [Chelatococcus asaccharovorans]